MDKYQMSKQFIKYLISTKYDNQNWTCDEFDKLLLKDCPFYRWSAPYHYAAYKKAVLQHKRIYGPKPKKHKIRFEKALTPLENLANLHGRTVANRETSKPI